MAKRKPKRLVLHVLPDKEIGWVVKVQSKRQWIHGYPSMDLQDAPFHYLRKCSAIYWGRFYCRAHKPSQLIIHKRDGVIQSERTFGQDPNPPKG